MGTPPGTVIPVLQQQECLGVPHTAPGRGGGPHPHTPPSAPSCPVLAAPTLCPTAPQGPSPAPWGDSGSQRWSQPPPPPPAGSAQPRLSPPSLFPLPESRKGGRSAPSHAGPTGLPGKLPLPPRPAGSDPRGMWGHVPPPQPLSNLSDRAGLGRSPCPPPLPPRPACVGSMCARTPSKAAETLQLIAC